MTKKPYIHRQYADSEKGAREFIAAETVLKLGPDATFIPDPAIAGVWMVKGIVSPYGGAAIIYMHGYKDPFGVERIGNDFEVGEA